MSNALEQGLMVRGLIDRANYKRREIIKTTWNELSDRKLIQDLPVTFNDLGNKKKGCVKTENQGYSIPLVGGGELVLGQITTKISDGYESIRELTVSLTTDNSRGKRITTPTLVIHRYGHNLRYLRPRYRGDKFDLKFAESEAKNMMANFQPKRDIDWKAVKSMKSPIATKVMKLWR